MIRRIRISIPHLKRRPVGLRHFSTRQLSHQTNGPSMRTSLALLGTTLFGLSAYTTYNVLNGVSTFIPYTLCSKQRKPLASDLDVEAFVSQVQLRLRDRLAVDDEVHRLLGTPVVVDSNTDNDWQLSIRCSEPGVKGIRITPELNVRIEARPFAPGTSGIDRVLLPFTPGEADSEDAMARRGDRPRREAYMEAWVTGSVNVQGSERRGVVKFSAVKDLDNVASVARFSSGVLLVELSNDGHESTMVERRLW